MHSRRYYQQVPLQPLEREPIEELLLDLLGSDASLAELPPRIYERTGGNPFFVEEVVQSLVENGSLAGSRGAPKHPKVFNKQSTSATPHDRE